MCVRCFTCSVSWPRSSCSIHSVLFHIALVHWLLCVAAMQNDPRYYGEWRKQIPVRERSNCWREEHICCHVTCVWRILVETLHATRICCLINSLSIRVDSEADERTVRCLCNKFQCSLRAGLRQCTQGCSSVVRNARLDSANQIRPTAGKPLTWHTLWSCSNCVVETLYSSNFFTLKEVIVYTEDS